MPAVKDEEVTGELVAAGEAEQATADLIMGRGELAESMDDPAKAQEAIVRRILTAPDVDAVLREDSTVATKELVGVPLEITDYRIMKSTLEGKSGGYLLIEATNLLDGTAVTLNTGAPKIMAQVIRLGQLDRIPVKVKVAEVGQAKPGQNRALQLVAA
jgi:hypothetical protein